MPRLWVKEKSHSNSGPGRGDGFHENTKNPRARIVYKKPMKNRSQTYQQLLEPTRRKQSLLRLGKYFLDKNQGAVK